jgi:hypothetical protein
MENDLSMQVREQKVHMVQCEGDLYMRHHKLDWYLYINNSWEYIPYIDCIQLEDDFLYAQSRNFE